MSHNSIILGIDPGYGRVGYGVIYNNNNTLSCVSVGCIETVKTDSASRRLHTIFKKLQNIIKQKKPHVLVVEQLFFAKNAKTALRVAETRGILLLLGEINNIPIREFTPLQVKLAVCGYGKADKTQIQQMVTRTLKLTNPPKPDDAADALAIALTAAFIKEWG